MSPLGHERTTRTVLALMLDQPVINPYSDPFNHGDCGTIRR